MKERFLNIVLGTRYKTDVVINLIPEWMKNNPKGNIIVFDPGYKIYANYQNEIDFMLMHTEDFKWVDHILQHKEAVLGKHGALLVLNGGDFLFPKTEKEDFFLKPGEVLPYLSEKHMDFVHRPKMHLKFLELLTLRRLLNLDIIITFNNPDSIPVTLDLYATHFIVLPVTEDYKPNKNICNYEILDTAIKSINSYSKKHSLAPTKEWLGINVQTGTIYPSFEINKRRFTNIVRKFKGTKRKVEILP